MTPLADTSRAGMTALADGPGAELLLLQVRVLQALVDGPAVEEHWDARQRELKAEEGEQSDQSDQGRDGGEGEAAADYN